MHHEDVPNMHMAARGSMVFHKVVQAFDRASSGRLDQQLVSLTSQLRVV